MASYAFKFFVVCYFGVCGTFLFKSASGDMCPTLNEESYNLTDFLVPTPNNHVYVVEGLNGAQRKKREVVLGTGGIEVSLAPSRTRLPPTTITTTTSKKRDADGTIITECFGRFTTTVPPNQSGSFVQLFYFYNSAFDSHLYSTDPTEFAKLEQVGFVQNNTFPQYFCASVAGTTPVACDNGATMQMNQPVKRFVRTIQDTTAGVVVDISYEMTTDATSSDSTYVLDRALICYVAPCV